MEGISKGLVLLAVLGFVLAIVSVFVGPIAGVSAEGFSRGCTNLTLVAIALHFVWKTNSTAG